jgi:hypothetical protein
MLCIPAASVALSVIGVFSQTNFRSARSGGNPDRQWGIAAARGKTHDRSSSKAKLDGGIQPL